MIKSALCPLCKYYYFERFTLHFVLTDKSRLRHLGRMAGRSLPVRLPVEQRRSEEAHLRLGHEEHQQPQRQHPKEVLSGSSRELSTPFVLLLQVTLSMIVSNSC